MSRTKPPEEPLINMSPCAVKLVGPGEQTLTVPPFGEVSQDRVDAFDTDQLDRYFCRVETQRDGMVGRRAARNEAAFGLVVLIGVLVPFVVVTVGTGLWDVALQDPGALWQAPLDQVVVYRLLQIAFLWIAATFPAMLFFLFDQYRIETLRVRFLVALFRLDTKIRSKSDWIARYGRQVAEAYGDPREGGGRTLRGRRTPVVLTTLLLSIGWVMAFLNLRATGTIPPTEPDAGVLTDGNLLAFFQPEQGIVVFGFLGAYFFGVNVTLRSYLRGDLHPKAYAQISARVLMVVAISAVVSLSPLESTETMCVVAFFAGIVPETVVHRLWELIPGFHREWFLNPFRAREDDLTTLQGIDIYDRTRLAEEGVTNVQALANANLVNLILRTRIPPARLVDWVDQAILRLHLTEPEPPNNASDGAESRTPSPVSAAALGALGIRKATDLLSLTGRSPTRGTAVWTPDLRPDDAAGVRGPDSPAAAPRAGLDLLADALGTTEAQRDRALARLRVLCSVMSDEEWMKELMRWHVDPPRRVQEIAAAGRGTELPQGPDMVHVTVRDLSVADVPAGRNGRGARSDLPTPEPAAK